MGNSASSSPYSSHLSLYQPEATLDSIFSPEFDYELWYHTVQNGHLEKAKSLQKAMLIKYSKHPELVASIKKLKNIPQAHLDLPSLNGMHEFEDIDRQLAKYV